MVMGATNRPHDVDPAILRRMPATFHVGLPVRTNCSQPLFVCDKQTLTVSDKCKSVGAAQH